MFKKFMLCYFVAVVATISIIVVEIGVRSAVLSPFILLESKVEEEGTQKYLTGYSSIQGDYFLTIKPKQNEMIMKDKESSFNVINKQFVYQKFNSVGNGEMKGPELELVTRNGIIPSFSNETNIAEKDRNLFFQTYVISKNDQVNKLELDNMKLSTAHNDTFSIVIYVLSFLIAGIITFLLNVKKSLRNLFTLFFPFLTALILPLGLNYFYTLNFFLIKTDSYIYSMLFSIFLPTLGSLLITTNVFQLMTDKKSIKTEENVPENQKSSSFLEFNKREKLVLLFTFTIGLLYFLSYYLLPLSLHIKMISNVGWFICWYLSMTFLFMIGYTILDRYIGNFENITMTNTFQRMQGEIEKSTNSNVQLFKKRDSKNETNAWVYSTNPFTVKSIKIFVTEGLLQHFDMNETKGVLLHEIGHIKLKHNRYILLLTCIIALLISTTIFYSRILLLSFGWWHYILLFPIGVIGLLILTEWLPNFVSKFFEHQADAYAVNHLEDKEIYVDTLLKLSKMNEDEMDNAIQKRRNWKESHPTFEKRVNYIKDLIDVDNDERSS
ncbi:M48 family metalloprotease [Evansella sp. AB-P1]|uniref:M48 family metallopeptidase n=1 Tax=Evansella sp. AB-P1 TaxID=3037653 RepID=UPI00241BFD65|nr:M48 family metalloprotease [Evansella sp. AB-P1]MDG5790187.1 M48 family metalloprotease [Evansella sp. AB-P1]